MWEPTAYYHDPGLIFMRLSRVYMSNPSKEMESQMDKCVPSSSKLKRHVRCAHASLMHVKKDCHRYRSCDEVVGWKDCGLTNNTVRLNYSS